MEKEKITKEINSDQIIDQKPIIIPSIRISVRTLVEFILRSGDIDSRHKGSMGMEKETRL